MLERGIIDAVVFLRKLQGEYHPKVKKLHMCFVDVANYFDRALKVFEWAFRIKEY